MLGSSMHIICDWESFTSSMSYWFQVLRWSRELGEIKTVIFPTVMWSSLHWIITDTTMLQPRVKNLALNVFPASYYLCGLGWWSSKWFTCSLQGTKFGLRPQIFEIEGLSRDNVYDLGYVINIYILK